MPSSGGRAVVALVDRRPRQTRPSGSLNAQLVRNAGLALGGVASALLMMPPPVLVTGANSRSVIEPRSCTDKPVEPVVEGEGDAIGLHVAALGRIE